MQIDFNFPIASIILYSIAALLLIYIGAVYCRRLFLVSRCQAKCSQEVDTQPDALPKASIILFSRDEPETLERNLPAFLEQDYPAPFEVVIVNEGSSEETNMVVGRLKLKYPNIYLTYTPDGARNLSRKKLALTLGIKAAKGDVVVISDPSVEIDSRRWLATLLRSFADSQVQVVLGYGRFAVPDWRFAGRLMRAFDLCADSCAWLTAAIMGHPYRGCGFNLAYRRDLFFENKGFSRSLNLREGDDDIFISEIANADNTVVELATDSMAANHALPYMRATADYRRSHAFTGRKLPKASRRAMAFGEWCLWLLTACCLAAAIVADPENAAGWIISGVAILAAFTLACVAWRKTIASLGGIRFALSLPFIIATRPLRNIILNLRSHLSKSNKYTWQ